MAVNSRNKVPDIKHIVDEINSRLVLQKKRSANLKTGNRNDPN